GADVGDRDANATVRAYVHHLRDPGRGDNGSAGVGVGEDDDGATVVRGVDLHGVRAGGDADGATHVLGRREVADVNGAADALCALRRGLEVPRGVEAEAAGRGVDVREVRVRGAERGVRSGVGDTELAAGVDGGGVRAIDETDEARHDRAGGDDGGAGEREREDGDDGVAGKRSAREIDETSH